MNIDVHKALDNGYHLIPVNGKVAFMGGYNDNIGWNAVEVTHESWEFWEENLDMGRLGYGLLLGEKYSGVCAIDFDTNDQEIIDRVVKFLDIPLVGIKVGSKGFTCFFRIDEEYPDRLIYQYKLNGSVAVEFFLGRKYTVIPPSPHPDGGHYRWEGDSLLNIDIQDLPILTVKEIEMVGEIINSASLSDALKNLPKTQTKDGGRWSTITSMAGRLIKQYPGDTMKVAGILVEVDRRLFPGDQFFLSKEKLGSSKTSDSDMANAMNWVGDFMKSCTTRDKELVALIEKAAEKEIRNNLVEDWSSPIPFSERELMTYSADFPEEILPDYLKEYFNDHKERKAMTIDGMVLSMLTGLGSLLQGRAKIYPKGRGDDFYIRPNLFSMIVAPSGMKKDSMVNSGLAFFNEIDRTLQMTDDLDDIKLKEEKLISLAKKRKKAIDTDDDLTEITAQIKQLQFEIMSEREKKPVLRFQNGTTEKMYLTCMENQKRGVLFHQSEFTGLVAMMNKRGSESMRSFFLKLANGTDAEGFSHETISGAKIKIGKLVGSMVASCQNDALNALLRPVRVGSIENDGFYQRFLYAFPRELPMIRQKVVKEAVDYSEIQNVFWLAYNANDFDCELTDESIDVFLDYEMNMQLKRAKNIDSALQSLQAKYLGTMPKIAFLLQFLHEKKYPRMIEKKYVLLAVEFMEWQKLTLEAFWTNSNTSMIYQLANSMLNDLKLGVYKDGDTLEKVRKVIKATSGDIIKATQILEEKNYIRLVSDGKKEYHIMVNPLWR